MKKFSLLLGTLGGALGGYLLSNQKLRDSLAAAKNSEHAAKLLGKHLQHDGKRLAKEVQAFIKSDDVQDNLTKAKKFAQKKLGEAKRQVEDFMQTGVSQMQNVVRQKTGKAKSSKKGFKTTNVRS